MSFAELAARWDWKPIPNCPGRYVLRAGSNLSPGQLLGAGAEVHEYHSPHARDTVLVAAFEGGGLISYRGPDGAHRHTLNTVEGFARKLDQLGLRLEPPSAGRP
jgi:hypothetical protein